MTFSKNGARKWLKKTGLCFIGIFLMFTGISSPVSAYSMCDPCCYPADYCCEMPGYYLWGKYIFWQFNLEGTEFARCGVANPVNLDGGFVQNNFNEEGCTFATGCDYNSGFKVGGLIDLGCCDWDFFAEYTWLCPDFERTIPDGTVANLTSAFIIDQDGFFGPILDSANGRLCDSFNVLDFGLGRTFNVCGCFLFRPHFGFKATWQDIKYTVTYNFDDNEIIPLFDFEYVSQHEIEFNGIGLRTGFDLAWEFSPCFSVVGEFAVSSIFSDVKVRRKDTLTTSILSDIFTETTCPVWTRFDHCALVPVLELFMGVRWDTNVCNCYDVFVQIGWENQVWFDFNRLLTIVPDTLQGPHGNLTLQGLTVGAGLGF